MAPGKSSQSEFSSSNDIYLKKIHTEFIKLLFLKHNFWFIMVLLLYPLQILYTMPIIGFLKKKLVQIRVK